MFEKKGERIKKGELMVWQAIREMIGEEDTARFRKNSTERFRFYLDETTYDIVFLEHVQL
ncbi:hypothetical protein LPY66_17375 [Dehalobacter sp. DCM]|uniref:hypothetical protein n=1 Tax=Dehalobacter sp. DCM TaxID=2907827 RepID=UPI003081974D|nr:hypothetical protein LPY66_17375 [Dehalobacter sp. DCM]